MKKVVRWCNIFIRRYLICYPQENITPYSRPSNPEPVADVNVLRASVHRYFKYNQSDLLYVLPYEPMYETAIEAIRKDGWLVQLYASEGGELFYTIASQKTPAIPRF